MMLPDFFTAQTLPSGGGIHDMVVDVADPVATTSMHAASITHNLFDFSPNMDVVNWSSAPITDWPATPSSFQKREALATLSKRCPHVNEDVLIIALEEHNFVVEDATDLLLGVGMDDAMSAFLVKVFLGVPHSILEDRVSKGYGCYFEM